MAGNRWFVQIDVSGGDNFDMVLDDYALEQFRTAVQEGHVFPIRDCAALNARHVIYYSWEKVND